VTNSTTKINGRKRFIVTDTPELLLTVVVLSAGMQDRDGAKPVLLDAYLLTPVRFVFADGGFTGRLLDWARTILATTLHTWLTAHRRLARDYERDPAISEAMIRWAAINTITRRIARGGPATPPAATHLHTSS
jgi:alpha-beta hydrolase superfamily lysophospholipase